MKVRSDDDSVVASVDETSVDDNIRFPACGKGKMEEDISCHGGSYTKDCRDPTGHLDQICVAKPEESCSIVLVPYKKIPEKEINCDSLSEAVVNVSVCTKSDTLIVSILANQGVDKKDLVLRLGRLQLPREA